MIDNALEFVDNFRSTVANLKKLSPKYPIYYAKETETTYWVSSLVHFVYNGVEFSRHHVESAHKYPSYSPEKWKEIKQMAVDRLHENAQECDKKAIPCTLDDVIGVTTSNL